MAELTIKQIGECVREAQIAFCLDKYPSFEVALARKIETALADSAKPAGEPSGLNTLAHQHCTTYSSGVGNEPASWTFTREDLGTFVAALASERCHHEDPVLEKLKYAVEVLPAHGYDVAEIRAVIAKASKGNAS